MTRSRTYSDLVKAWLAIPGNFLCEGQARIDLRYQLATLDRIEIDQKYPNLGEDARWNKCRDDVQIERLHKNLLRENRNGIIQPEKTNHGLKHGLVGEENSSQAQRLKARNARHNPINNPINGPINNPINGAKIKEKNRIARDDWFRKNNPEQAELLVTPEQAEVLLQKILDTNFPELGNLSIQDFLRMNPNAGLYVGMTGQILELEHLRWLTKRGRPMKAGEDYDGRETQKNRPSILKSDDKTIKEKEAREKYGFKSFVVYESPIKTNVCYVEDALQEFLQHKFNDNGRDGLILGRRFWRHVAKGDKTHKEYGHYKTFVTFSANIGDYYGENGTVKVNH